MSFIFKLLYIKIYNNIMFIYKKLIYDYYIENKSLFIGYFIVIIILYFLESIAISRLNAKLI